MQKPCACAWSFFQTYLEGKPSVHVIERDSFSMKTVYLVDANAFFYRAFFAIKDLCTSDGFPTGAIFGFSTMLKKLLDEYSPTHIACCFDVSRKTFRTELYKEYKMNRPALDDRLKMQIPYIREIVSAYGIAIVEKESFEADDCIASIARLAQAVPMAVRIVSSDKDMCQLIRGSSVVVLDPLKKKIIDEKEFVSLFAFSPGLMVDFISLAGDAADNIPGIKGIGEKTAAALVSQFGTIENIIACTEQIKKDKLRESIRTHAEVLHHNKRLIMLKDDVPCISDIEEVRYKGADHEKLFELFRKFEFKKLIDQHKVAVNRPDPLRDAPEEAFSADISLLKGKISQTKQLLFILEGGAAYVYTSEEIFKVPIADLRTVFEDESILKITFNSKEALRVLHSMSLVLRGRVFDISLAASVVDSACVKADEESICHFFLKENPPAAGAPARMRLFFKLFTVLMEKIKEYSLESLLYETEQPLMPVLLSMEESGVKTNGPYLKGLSGEIEEQIVEIRKQVFAEAGEEFNLNSPQQLARVLFEKMRLPARYKTKTGFSTNEEVLQSLAATYPIAERMLAYRSLHKVQNTYVVPFIEESAGHNGFIHARFEQATTNTGRLSSHSPNLQNIPARGEWADRIRQAFVASMPGGFLICADYSQIELRVLASLSKDDHLTQAFREDKDIHRVTASLIFGKEESAVTDDERGVAKKINFGIVYGISAFGLSKQLGLDPKEAESFIHQYFSRYPGVQRYIDNVIHDAEKNGYVSTLLGRRRSLPYITSDNRQLKEFAQRQAVNTPVQGTAAEIIKRAMLLLYERLQRRKFSSRLIIQIHDELILDVAAAEASAVVREVVQTMEHALSLSVPLKVVVYQGRNWGQMEEVTL